MIRIGWIAVNGPTMLLMFVGWALTASQLRGSLLVFSPLAIPVGSLLGWLWWSFSIPRWRLWAMRRVEDLSALHQAAWRAQLEWPKGHFFERTEFKPHRYTLDEHELSVRYYVGRLVRRFDAVSGRNAQERLPSGAGDKTTWQNQSYRDFIEQARQLLKVMGLRSLHVGFNPAVETELEKMLESMKKFDIHLPDMAWQGGEVQLRRLLSEYLALLKQDH